MATTPSSNTATATEITKENTPTEDEKDNQVNVVETTDTHPKPSKDRATKSEIESEAAAPSKTEVGETVAEDAKGEHDKSNKSDDVEPTVSDPKTDEDRAIKSESDTSAITPNEDNIDETTVEEAKAEDNREAAAGTIATVAADPKASEDNSVKSKMDATTIAPIDNKTIETVTETTGVEKVESHKSTDTESPVTDPAIDKDRAVNSDITPATASPTADKAPEATTESVDVENTESHHPDIGETSVSDSQAGKDSAAESKVDPKATPSSDNTTTGSTVETLTTGSEQNSQIDTSKTTVTPATDDKKVSSETIAPAKTSDDTAEFGTATTTSGQNTLTKTEVKSSNHATNHPDTTDSSTDATSQPDEPTISIEATNSAPTTPSTEDNPVQLNVDQKVIDQKSDKDNQDNPTAIEKNPKSKVTDDEETISKTRQKDPKSNIVEKEDDTILIVQKGLKAKTVKDAEPASPLDQKTSALKQKESKEKTLAKSVHSTKAAAKALPPMGMQNSHWLQALGIALLGMVFALSIGLTSKKKHEKN